MRKPLLLSHRLRKATLKHEKLLKLLWSREKCTSGILDVLNICFKGSLCLLKRYFFSDMYFKSLVSLSILGLMVY